MFINLKSHDCHVLMTQLLPVALRVILPENVRLAVVKLCAFLNEISQKAIDPNKLTRLQAYHEKELQRIQSQAENELREVSCKFLKMLLSWRFSILMKYI